MLGLVFTGDSSIQDVNKMDSKTGTSAHASKDISQGKVVNSTSQLPDVISSRHRGPVSCAGIRHHARERIQKALAKNPVSATQKDAESVAQKLEEACFQRAETGGNPR